MGNINQKSEIPIKYEEAYINGKDSDSYSENEIIEIFSKIKYKITDVFLMRRIKIKIIVKKFPIQKILKLFNIKTAICLLKNSLILIQN
jgi:hypothetical protein